MILKALRLRNFRSFANDRIEFGDEQNYVVGANWQGKSSLVEAVAFALFGREALPRVVAGSSVTAEDLVNDGAKDAEVELTFVLRDDEYTIRRTLPRSVVKLTCNGTEMARGPQPVKEKLKDLLEVDAKFFANVFYADQDELRRSLSLGPKERQTFVEGLMGQEEWRNRIVGLNEARKQLTNFSEGLEQGKFRGFLEQRGNLGEAIGEDRERLASLKEEIASLNQRKQLAKRADSEKANTNTLKVHDREAALDHEGKALARVVRDLAKGRCPTCTQPVPVPLRKSRLAELQRLVRANEKELRRTRKELDDLLSDEEDDENDFSEDDRDELNQLIGQQEILVREHARRKTELNDLRTQEKSYGKTPGQHERATGEVAFLQRVIAVIGEHLAALRRNVADELATAMNELLTRFHDGDFDAEAVIGEDMDFSVKQHGRTVALSYLSGAQKDVFAIALRYGLMRVAARQVDCLILDEPTRHMDPSNVRQLKAVFNDIDGHQLLIVTVQEEFADARGRHFVVKKNEKLQSRVERR